MPFIVPLLGSPAVLGGIDAGNEAWVFSLYGAVLDDTNWVAQQALWDTLVTKSTALILGAKKYTEYGNIVNFSYTQPTNGAAREIALIVQAKDTITQQRYSYRLPCIDPLIPSYVENNDAKDVIQVTTPTAIADFVIAFNAFAVSPATGNALSAYGLRVGRGGK